MAALPVDGHESTGTGGRVVVVVGDVAVVVGSVVVVVIGDVVVVVGSVVAVVGDVVVVVGSVVAVVGDVVVVVVVVDVVVGELAVAGLASTSTLVRSPKVPINATNARARLARRDTFTSLIYWLASNS
jgi:hypothetical protein